MTKEQKKLRLQERQKEYSELITEIIKYITSKSEIKILPNIKVQNSKGVVFSIGNYGKYIIPTYFNTTSGNIAFFDIHNYKGENQIQAALITTTIIDYFHIKQNLERIIDSLVYVDIEKLEHYEKMQSLSFDYEQMPNVNFIQKPIIYSFLNQ